jgi:hypothetical protein
MRSGFKLQGLPKKRSKPFWTVVLLLVLVLIPVLPAAAYGPQVQEINTPGFGSPENNYAWSMAWFKGKLYVGTAKHVSCVEWATVDFYLHDGSYNTSPSLGVTCPADRYDMNLQAEIWQYTPGIGTTGNWKRVYQAPADIPNPRAPGKFVARDIGYRGMAVYQDPSGQESLYVAGVTANEYIPEIAADHPPRILRTTDGETFAPIPGDPGLVNTMIKEGQVTKRPMGFRSLVVNDGHLYVTASAGLTGDGVIMEVQEPWGPNPTFVQVSPGDMQVFEIESFNGTLYAGTGAFNGGYGVSRMNETGEPPYQFTPIITDGAGRGKEISSVVSMHVYQDQLYVGASGWYSTDIPASELVRINPDDSWDVVVGNARITTSGFKFPVSGLPDGFGNIFSAHFWRMEDHQDALYVGTNDWSWFLHYYFPILDFFFFYQYGYDVYGSCDGNYWFVGTQNAFGDGLYNFGARTMASTPAGAFIGRANHIQGTRVWRGTGLSICGGGNSISSVGSPDNPIPPGQLMADVQSCGTVLSWDSAPGAQSYRIQRAEYRPNSSVGAPAPLKFSQLPNDLPLLYPNRGTAKTVPTNASFLGEFTEIGTTSGSSFVDSSAKPGVRYAYQVVADYGQNALSGPSNLVVVPSEAPKVTFDSMSTEIQNLADQGKVDGGTAQSLLSDLSQARTAASSGDRTGAAQILQNLGRVTDQSKGRTITASAAKDLQPMLLRLQRSTSVDKTACNATGPNDGGSPSPSPSPSSSPQPSTSPNPSSSPQPSAPPSPSPSPPSGSSRSFFDLLRSIWGKSGTSGVIGRGI